MRTHNPDRIPKRKIPRGWRYIKSEELAVTKAVREIRICEPVEKHFAPPIKVRNVPWSFTVLVKK